MNIREYLSLNRNKIVLAFDKEDIKDLLNFKEIAKNELDIIFNLNVKYIDLWLKYIKNEFFNISLSTSSSAIKFSNTNITYIVMPMRVL